MTGILNKSEEAKAQVEKVQLEEIINMVLYQYDKESVNDRSLDKGDFVRTKLEEKYGQGNVTVTERMIKDKPLLKIKVNDSIKYYVYGDGELEDNSTEYTNNRDTVYHKYEEYESTQSPEYDYQNSENMVILECDNYNMKFPYNCQESAYYGCVNLEAIIMPVAISTGHYVFSKLPKLKYLELGSIGHPWTSGGRFMGNALIDLGYTSGDIGSPAGLTIVAYMNEYSASAGFIGTPTPDTKIIIRSAVTGEILEPGD